MGQVTRVFIDGSAGTTGLRIQERLSEREDLKLIILPDDKRKDPEHIRKAFREADIAFLCLPDAAAREAVELAADSGCRIIDTSTAHRTASGWVYGFPELTGHRKMISGARLVANPGCHASGFIALVAPLVEHGLLERETALACISITGYSGGGKKMIAQYECTDGGSSSACAVEGGSNHGERVSSRPGHGKAGRDVLLDAPRIYGIGQQHKHLKEMKAVCGISTVPAFYPIVSDYYAGMETNIPVFAKDLKGTMEDVRELYRSIYTGPVVRYQESVDVGGFISAGALAGRDDMVISVAGNDERLTLIALFDNLGKGASGAAIQNMNIMLGVDETAGLVV